MGIVRQSDMKPSGLETCKDRDKALVHCQLGKGEGKGLVGLNPVKLFFQKHMKCLSFGKIPQSFYSLKKHTRLIEYLHTMAPLSCQTVYIFHRINVTDLSPANDFILQKKISGRLPLVVRKTSFFCLVQRDNKHPILL